MDVLGTVEAGRTAGTDTVGAEGGYGFFFEGFVGDEVVVVVGGEVCDCAAVGETGFGSGGAVGMQSAGRRFEC